MKSMILEFLRDEEGAAAIEYGLLAGLISVMIIGGSTLMGTNISALFNTIAGTLSSANTKAGTAAAAT